MTFQALGIVLCILGIICCSEKEPTPEEDGNLRAFLSLDEIIEFRGPKTLIHRRCDQEGVFQFRNAPGEDWKSSERIPETELVAIKGHLRPPNPYAGIGSGSVTCGAEQDHTASQLWFSLPPYVTVLAGERILDESDIEEIKSFEMKQTYKVGDKIKRFEFQDLRFLKVNVSFQDKTTGKEVPFEAVFEPFAVNEEKRVKATRNGYELSFAGPDDLMYTSCRDRPRFQFREGPGDEYGDGINLLEDPFVAELDGKIQQLGKWDWCDIHSTSPIARIKASIPETYLRRVGERPILADELKALSAEPDAKRVDEKPGVTIPVLKTQKTRYVRVLARWRAGVPNKGLTFYESIHEFDLGP